MRIQSIQNNNTDKPIQNSKGSLHDRVVEKGAPWSKAAIGAVALFGIAAFGLGAALASSFQMPPVQGPNPPTPAPAPSLEDIPPSSTPLPWSQMNISAEECEKVLNSRPDDAMTKIARTIDKVHPFCKLPVILIDEYVHETKMTAPIMRGLSSSDEPGIAILMEMQRNYEINTISQTMVQQDQDTMYLNPANIHTGIFSNAFCGAGSILPTRGQIQQKSFDYLTKRFTKLITEGLSGQAGCSTKLARTVDFK